VHARSLETIDALLEVQSGPRPKGPFPEPDHSVLSRFDLGSTTGLARAIETGDDFMSMQGAAETAVALRRYRIDRGAYPDDLTTLVPAYLPALPIDPFTGKPPVYGRQGSGFTLQAQRYSPRAAQPWPPITWVVRK